jgi:hypothetical protein
VNPYMYLLVTVPGHVVAGEWSVKDRSPIEVPILLYRRKEVSSHWSVNFDSGGTFNAFVLFRRYPSWSPQDRT